MKKFNIIIAVISHLLLTYLMLHLMYQELFIIGQYKNIYEVGVMNILTKIIWLIIVNGFLWSQYNPDQ